MSLALAERRDLDVGQLLLQVVGTGLRLPALPVEARVTDAIVERTMDGASTLKIDLDDTDRAVLRSGVIDRQVDLQVDGVWWRLVQVSKNGDQLELTFEDRVVALLRTYDQPRKASRAKMTRAEFALSLVREVKQGGAIPFICPQLHVTQPIETVKQKVTASSRAANVQQGISPGAQLTVQHSPASASQRDVGQRVLDVANSLGAGERPTLALLQACIQESGLQNLSYGDSTSTGVLQLLSSTGQGMGIDPRDVEACTNAFLTRGFYTDPQLGGGGAIVIAAKHPEASTGRVAQACQGSAYPAAYDQWQTEAQQWLAAYGGPVGGSAALSTSVTKTLPYQFQRGGTDGTKEDSWTCLQRLASEVNWRCFVTQGSVYFVSETTLLKANPLVTISEATLGVDGINFDVDNGKVNSQATVTARASRWAVPPGSVVELKDCGPASDRWLVQTIDRSLFDAEATITLKRATKPLGEPAPQTTSVSSSTTDPNLVSVANGGNAPDDVANLYLAAQAFSAKRWPYVYGGGHGACGVASSSTIANPSTGAADPGVGFDCSASVCAILGAAGMGFRPGGPVDGSTVLAGTWGQPGKGRYFTVYANPTHAFGVFHTSQGDQCFSTGMLGSDWDGGGLKPEMHTTDGFTAKHWPGT